MITKELKQQILSLSSDEQDEIVQVIQAKTNLWAGITKRHGFAGVDACMAKARILTEGCNVFKKKGQAKSNPEYL